MSPTNPNKQYTLHHIQVETWNGSRMIQRPLLLRAVAVAAAVLVAPALLSLLLSPPLAELGALLLPVLLSASS